SRAPSDGGEIHCCSRIQSNRRGCEYSRSDCCRHSGGDHQGRACLKLRPTWFVGRLPGSKDRLRLAPAPTASSRCRWQSPPSPCLASFHPARVSLTLFRGRSQRKCSLGVSTD